MKEKIYWIVKELMELGMDETEIIDFFQECIDEVKKTNKQSTDEKIRNYERNKI